MAALLLLQTGLFQYAVESACRHVDSRVARYRDGSGLRRMLKLAVTTLRPDKYPAVGLDRREQFADLH